MASTVTLFDANSFAHPELNDRPWVRMNMPPNADPEELKAEIRDLHRSGIAGIEVGQGAFPNNEQLVAILKEATRFGLKVSLSHGPTQYPVGYSLDDDNARTVLCHLRHYADDGVAVLLVTHDARAASFADRTCIIESGKIRN